MLRGVFDQFKQNKAYFEEKLLLYRLAIHTKKIHAEIITKKTLKRM